MTTSTKKRTGVIDWLRFLAGLFALALFAGFFASGYTPPGICGEVLRHNQANEIDASPFFYGDVENMAEYEQGVRQMRDAARLK
jgi:hypothetical protein